MAVNVKLPDGTIDRHGDEGGETVWFLHGSGDPIGSPQTATLEIRRLPNYDIVAVYGRNQWESYEDPA